MFDIGFSELLVVALVALLVIGPERMPEAVHKVLSTWRTIKRSLYNARRDVEREMGVDDIRRRIHNEEIMRSLNASRAEIEAVKQDINGAAQAVNNAMQDSLTAAQASPVAEPPASQDKPAV